ncbi:TPA: transporter substrate-binding domain-containing protein, partial [Listeria monocytogenes]|nr:transporter substrate-binding domain-containing protein [Listeria monocytogenes]
TDFAVGMRKSDKELQKKINEAFEKLYKEGKMQEISKKWFGDDEIAKQ